MPATQTMTVAVRALATRELTDVNALASDRARAVGRGAQRTAFAVITGVAAWAWFKVPGLGIVIGLAMLVQHGRLPRSAAFSFRSG